MRAATSGDKRARLSMKAVASRCLACLQDAAWTACPWLLLLLLLLLKPNG